MQIVQIDDDAIRAVFDSYAGDPVPPCPSGDDQGEDPLEGGYIPGGYKSGRFQKTAEIACLLLFEKLVPAWEVPEDEQLEWADTLGECLDELLPASLAEPDEEDQGPIVRLLMKTGMCARHGVDVKNMKIKPMRYSNDVEQPGGAAAAAVQQSGPFTTVVDDEN